MKKLLFYLVFMVWFPINLYCNIFYPYARISELAFDTSGNWIMEMEFAGYADTFHIDSIIFETVSGISRVANYTPFQPYGSESYYLALITKDSLNLPLEIDKDNDLIRLVTYWSYGRYESTLPLGTFICDLPESYSVAHIDGYDCRGFYFSRYSRYAIDRTPSIGGINNSEGAESTVTGYVYDKNYNPVVDTFILAFNSCTNTNGVGYYTIRTLAKCYTVDTVEFFGLKYIYEPVAIQLMPDSSYTQDLVLLSIQSDVSTQEISQNEPVITYYPNPFTTGSTLYISIPTELSYSTAVIEFYNSAGSFIFSELLENRTSVIELSSEKLSLKPGIYYSLIRIDGLVKTKTHALVKL